MKIHEELRRTLMKNIKSIEERLYLDLLIAILSIKTSIK